MPLPARTSWRLPFWLPLSLLACSGEPTEDSPTDTDTQPVSDADEDGYATEEGDCDDTDATVNPDATEIYYDGIDQNCDELSDNDADLDGAEVDTDCNDNDATILPGAEEICDGVDNNCADGVDEGVAIEGWTDADGDGYGDATLPVSVCEPDPSIVENGDDCNDHDPALSPAALDICDGVDNDCDGVVDGDATYHTTYYADMDGDTYGDPSFSTSACSEPVGSVTDMTDCDDANGATYPGAPELDNLVDDDCDLWVDEDFVAVGDIVLTEVARQPLVGTSATVAEAMWLEVYNASARTVDLSSWYVQTTTGAFFIDPADAFLLAPGEYGVLCKTDDYEGSSSAIFPLVCDYLWGAEGEDPAYVSTHHTNTFTLQADADTLAIYLHGDESVGTQIDGLGWTYVDGATSTDWPRDPGQSMGLDPDLLDALSNDANTSWCSTISATWWVSSDASDYGTPGAANEDCL